jgi:predicted O-methyltransferase YrrM
MRLYPTLPKCAKAELFHKRDDSLEGVTDEVGDLLYALVRMTKPKVCIETGTHIGDSAEKIGRALQANGSGYLLTCDISDVWVASASERLKDLPVRVIKASGNEILRNRPDTPDGKRDLMDFVFIDSGTAQERCDELMLLNESNIAPLGIVAWHDACVGYPNMYDAFAPARDWPHLVFPSIVGIAVFQRPE